MIQGQSPIYQSKTVESADKVYKRMEPVLVKTI